MNRREKWNKFLAGEDVGPVVCPLCDKWPIIDEDFPEPEPFTGGEDRKSFYGQINMARAFEWDPLYYVTINFSPNNTELNPVTEKKISGNRTQTFSKIKTPFGDLTRVDETNGLTQRSVKEYLETEADYEKMCWLTEALCDFDREAALADGRMLREAAGDSGMIGTWVSPSVMLADVQSLYYHIMDYPEAFKKLRDATKKLTRMRLEVYAESGFDFMFYCVPSTDWTSPGFFREWMADEVYENIAWWKSNGGFTLWHGCGHVKAYVETNVFNDMRPEIVETLSEPPVGNVPSLSWARKKIDPEIITKGNIPLNILYEGTPDEVREEVRRVKKETEGYRHIIALSDNVLTGTPAENLRAYVDEGYK